MATLSDLLRQGYTPPTESALADPIKEHFRTLPQKFNENQAAQMNLLARAYPGNTFKSMMLEGDPKAMGELAMQAPIVGMMAYHGTPHKILDKFDISKVGTGEGAQAYGHGMYFAENPSVATQYKNILSKPEFTKNAEGVELRGQLPRMLEESYSELAAKNGLQQTNYGDVTDIVGQRLDRQMKDALKANDMNWYNKVADMKLDLARFKENPPPNTGNLYKVDIPDEYIPNMLDWDKPLSKMTKKEAAIIEPLKQKLIESKNPYHPDSFDTIGQVIQFSRGSNPNLEKELLQAGIPGIRYLDQGSRGTGKGSSNFVVFDPSTVKILEENSKPVSRKALIEKQVKALKE
jgi:hypothetical protein